MTEERFSEAIPTEAEWRVFLVRPAIERLKEQCHYGAGPNATDHAAVTVNRGDLRIALGTLDERDECIKTLEDDRRILIRDTERAEAAFATANERIKGLRMLAERANDRSAEYIIKADKTDKAEAERDRLRDAVTELCDQWNETPDYTPSVYDQGRVDQRHDMTMQLLTVLAAGSDTASTGGDNV